MHGTRGKSCRSVLRLRPTSSATRPRFTPSERLLHRTTGGAAALGVPASSLGSSASLFFSLPGVAFWAGASLAAAAARSTFKRLFRRGRRPKRSVARMAEGNFAQFSIATMNLRAIMDRWTERRPVLQSCLKEIDADVLCFQECLTGEYGQDRSLVGSSYHVFPCKAALFNLMCSGSRVLHWYARSVSALLDFRPAQSIMVGMPVAIESFRERFRLDGSFFRGLRDMAIAPFFGNSVACRLADAREINHSTLVLGDWRAAQRIEFELGDESDKSQTGSKEGSPRAVPACGPSPRFKVWVVNTHLDHDHPDTRQRQALEVIEWMEPARAECAAVVLCGDFNGTPDEPFHELLRSRGYRSGYSLRHGHEPMGTWPTGIQAPLMDQGPFECLDFVYVWAAEGYDLRVTEASVFGDQPDPKDPTLFPSDHAAVKVSLRLEKLQEAPSGGLSIGKSDDLAASL